MPSGDGPQPVDLAARPVGRTPTASAARGPRRGEVVHRVVAGEAADGASGKHIDCEAVERNLGPDQNARLARAARANIGPAPSIHYDEFPREVSKREIEISAAAARLAGALHLHLD